ncbi:MAG TPA: Sir2 family NAD-dependent protein deacetylase, partial [Ramlibacter sp.]|nr:Sir2 family NAD-dependent protein deacetylase [Ramlibacter sp.]
GVSAESGVPTFREAQTGLWARFDPQQLATEEAFRADPARVWGWYAFRRELVAQVQPNAAHRALAVFAQRHPGRLTLITQNVDGLHQRAGSPGVLALHGNLLEDRWLDAPRSCCDRAAVQAGSPPCCPRCGNLLRPAVVWFGEMLPAETLAAAEHAADTCDLMLVVGTSGAVWPAAGLARRARGRVVIVNPETTELDDAADAALCGKAAELLPPLLED